MELGRRRAVRRAARLRRQPAACTTRTSSPPAPTSWDVVFDKAGDYTGKVTAYDSPIYIADAAVYLMAHQPDLGIENPYALDEEQLAGGGRPAEGSSARTSASTGRTTSRRSRRSRPATRSSARRWQVIQNVLEGEGATTEVVLPDEGATGWSDTWMIASEAKNPNCAYAWLDYIASPEANAPATDVLRRGAVEPGRVRVPRGLRGVPRR